MKIYEPQHLLIFVYIYIFCTPDGAMDLTFQMNVRNQKNAAKRSRQHAGKKYREYAQRRVCFVNKQVPCPTPI